MFLRKRDRAAQHVSKIPASRWGVTKAQFEEFVGVVRAFVAKGLIENSVTHWKSEEKTIKRLQLYPLAKKKLSLETVNKTIKEPLFVYPDWKFNSTRIGPNIHQHKWEGLAGKGALKKSSWALMKNPQDGVEADLFVSHAWHEGIFEFANHLLEACPPECNAAYICFLSNPQHLVHHFLGDHLLEESPFHIAMTSPSMKHVTVIATQNIPIHTRIWCCYEAYLAMDLGLPMCIGGDEKNLSTQQERLKEHAPRTVKEREKRTTRVRKELFKDYCTGAALEAIHERIDRERSKKGRVAAAVLAIVLLFCFPLFVLGCSTKYFFLSPFMIGSRGNIIIQEAKEEEDVIHEKEQVKLESIQKFAVDVRDATASNENDRSAILSAIGDASERVNAMLTDLIFRGKKEL
ncbi:expressed unknown protein [Seminavis robusta]|uniref:Uncharacterized protein n=1 Tax=Seminavis robusta TaxID=568900 RepID=A0A9N8EPD3_9STRA|nr:expressed unknown protein [Seminavis robusta]|eukprot:Sro1334_g263750.1 n/a (404) ;mRNA; f:4449-5902